MNGGFPLIVRWMVVLVISLYAQIGSVRDIRCWNFDGWKVKKWVGSPVLMGYNALYVQKKQQAHTPKKGDETGKYAEINEKVWPALK